MGGLVTDSVEKGKVVYSKRLSNANLAKDMGPRAGKNLQIQVLKRVVLS